MPHQIQNHETAACFSDIRNQLGDLLLAQMMHHAHADGNVGSRQDVAHGVQLQNPQTFFAGFGRLQIHAHHLRPYSPPDLFHERAMPAADIQNPAYRPIFGSQCTQNRLMISQKGMRSQQSAMGPLDDVARQPALIQNFFFEGAAHLLYHRLSRIITPPYNHSQEGRMPAIDIVGGGPAGSMAAITAARYGAPVRIFEKSAFPRHKVCGEFLSPAILTLLRRAGCETDFLKLGPSLLREMRLHFGAKVVRHILPEPAHGLSRYEFDRLLLQHAVKTGAELVRDHGSTAIPGHAAIWAAGRKSVAPPASERLFGFKAHFTGPVNDAVELYFFENCYVGVSAIENGATNVCGLAPERTLRACGFHPEELLARCPALAERLRPLAPVMDWLMTGPLVFSEQIGQPLDRRVYRAGDALGFIDPFTGSGMLNAMLTGELAARAAVRGAPVEEYVGQCRRLLRRPFRISAAVRAALACGLADLLAPLVPGRLLFYATRPAADHAILSS